MSAYALAVTQVPSDEKLLRAALAQPEERVRARKLQKRVADDASRSRLASRSRTWETIALDRLVLVLVRLGRASEAVDVSCESQQRRSNDDPTVTAFSRFNRGYALWHNGQQEEALSYWNAPDGTCSPAMVFCKEPAIEHLAYLELMAEAGVNFDTRDEQGFSALECATFSNSDEGRQLTSHVVEGLRRSFQAQISQSTPNLSEEEVKTRVERKIALRRKEARLRRVYRLVLQEHLRPVLSTGQADAISKLRLAYAQSLKPNPDFNEVFDGFYYIRYRDFSILQAVERWTCGSVFDRRWRPFRDAGRAARDIHLIPVAGRDAETSPKRP